MLSPSWRLVPVVLLFAAAPARAVEVELDAETIGQGYQLRAGDDTLVNRRRLTQYLGLNVAGIGPHDLVGRPMRENQFYLSLSLRFDAELGDYAPLGDLSGRTRSRELVADRLDLLWAFVGARDLAGFLDARLGRQLQFDLFDYLAFDGLSLSAKTPVHLQVEAWGGLNVSGAQPFDSPVTRIDGVALGGNPLGSLDARQEQALQPTFGVALATFGLRDAQVRVTYFRTMSETVSRRPGENGWGVLDEKVGVTARGRLFSGRLHAWLGFRHNLLVGRPDEAQGALRLQLGGHGVQLEYVYAAPTFDGDSIWNVFGAQAFNDARASWDARLGPVSLVARGFARLFATGPTSWTGAKEPPGLASFSAGASAGARLSVPRGFLRLDGYYEDGFGGRKGGVDASARLRLFGEPEGGLVADGRISFVHWQDDARALARGDSIGLQAGLRYRFYQGLTLHLAIEENVSRYYASQFRAYAMVDVSYYLGLRPRGFVRPRAWSF